MTVEAGQRGRRPLNGDFLHASRLAFQISARTGSASHRGHQLSPLSDHRRARGHFLFKGKWASAAFSNEGSQYLLFLSLGKLVFFFFAVRLARTIPQQHSGSGPSLPEAGLSRPTNGITMVCYCLQWPRHSLTRIGALLQFSQLSSIWRSPGIATGKKKKNVLCFCWGS